MKCGHCGAAVPEDSDRCPKCLRRSSVIASEPEKKDPAEDDRARMLRTGRKIGVTILVLGLGFLVIGVLILALGRLVLRFGM